MRQFLKRRKINGDGRYGKSSSNYRNFKQMRPKKPNTQTFEIKTNHGRKTCTLSLGHLSEDFADKLPHIYMPIFLQENKYLVDQNTERSSQNE